MLLALQGSCPTAGRAGTTGRAGSRRYPPGRPDSDRPMNKPEGIESGPAISGLLQQAIAFVGDFAAFAGISGVVAAAFAVVAAAFEGVGLLLLVPLLSTASDTGAGWTHRLIVQAFEIAGAEMREKMKSMVRMTAAATSNSTRPIKTITRPTKPAMMPAASRLRFSSPI